MTGTPPAISTAAGLATKHGSTTSTSSPGSRMARSASQNASLTPTVTSTSSSGSYWRPYSRSTYCAIARRSSNVPALEV
jgi:hypothetical protein